MAAAPRNRKRAPPTVLLKKLWLANKRRPPPIHFVEVECRVQVVGSEAIYLNALVDQQVRATVVPCYKHWNRIPQNERKSILDTVQMFFDLRGQEAGVGYSAALTAVESAAKRYYYEYLEEAHKHYKEHGRRNCFGSLGIDQWLRCIDLFMYFDLAREVRQLQRTVAQLLGNANPNEEIDGTP